MSSPDTTRPTPPAARRPSRRRVLVLAVVGCVLLAAAGWTIAWQLVALRVEASLRSWIDQRLALGDTLEHGPMTISGFPMRVEVSAREVHWTRSDGQTLLTAAAQGVVASVAVWDPFRLTVRAVGGGRASAAGPWGAITGDAGKAGAKLTIGPRAPRRIQLVLGDLTLTAPGGAPVATVESVDATVEPNPAPTGGAIAGEVPTTLAVSGHAEGIRPAGAETLPFDGPASATATLDLRGPVDPAAGIPGLAQWRDAGGVIDIRSLSVSWAPVDLIGDGTFALDAALRPEGAGTAEVRGAPAAVDRLVKLGRLKVNQAALIKLAMIAASEPSDDGSGDLIKAPVTIQDGTLKVGQFTVAKVRSIAE